MVDVDLFGSSWLAVWILCYCSNREHIYGLYLDDNIVYDEHVCMWINPWLMVVFTFMFMEVVVLVWILLFMSKLCTLDFGFLFNVLKMYAFLFDSKMHVLFYKSMDLAFLAKRNCADLNM